MEKHEKLQAIFYAAPKKLIKMPFRKRARTSSMRQPSWHLPLRCPRINDIWCFQRYISISQMPAPRALSLFVHLVCTL